MTKDEFRQLNIGDIVENRWSVGETYMVIDKDGTRITAVRIMDDTSYHEWELVTKKRDTPKRPTLK